MFKQITALLLLIAFLASSFSREFLVISYYTNQSSFAKNCINKAKPTLHCNGKCQLMKKLKEEQKKDEQNPERRMDLKNEIISSRSFFASITGLFIVAFQPTQFPFQTGSPAEFAHSIFHPPALV